ncbi:DUF6377 domain-containing protein [Mucilaginibacter ginkgonis]|uniref:Tetratricopeptide repeat protein n=1 Tax=Mucilaginibacter ginkgonis TaxID=2682091 RepID=A0A6I4I1N0_9SPHI|nr:DUF6377 domain-containing protein [Mucilaginibacter ginkgonis]QQL51470.1 tetratricopeptide repeat protein [Mucilaginibacter ginkgonis]
MAVLKTEIAKKAQYDHQKEIRIGQFRKKLINLSASDLEGQYRACEPLYDEYRSYKFDSAYVYTVKLRDLAKKLNDPSKINATRLKLGFILLSAGMFKETFECFGSINTRFLDDTLKERYYTLYARAYADLASYNSDNIYTPGDYENSKKYLDSAIRIAKPNSYDQFTNLGEMQIRTGQTNEPSIYYQKLLDSFPLTAHQRAMAATGLSSFYVGDSKRDERICLLLIGAINDVRSSTKETLAIFRLGEELQSEGDIISAYTFIEEAMANAQYYGARLRTLKIGAALPIIAAQRLILIENEKKRFLMYILSIATIAVIIALISFIVFIQLKRLKVKEKIIEDKNVQLEKINIRLTEDTRIKEEYIGSFFSTISGYISVLEKLKRSIERKLTTKKYDEILVTINEVNIKKERENLFHSFDQIFLKIFPNFITAFNTLFKPEDQIWPKDHEVLNTDLRIFALMRLGINDNQAVADILQYSVNTIYVYKMRIKAKALVPGDHFDQKIMAVKAVDADTKS